MNTLNNAEKLIFVKSKAKNLLVLSKSVEGVVESLEKVSKEDRYM